MQWWPQRRPRACFSGGVDSRLSLYFKISRAPCESCRCLPFILKKKAVVSVTVFQENNVLCQSGRLQQVSDVDTSLLSMLQGPLSTSETSESVAGRLHSVSTAASAEGIHLDAALDDKFSLHVEFGRCQVFLNLHCMQSFTLGGCGPVIPCI